LGQYTLLVKTRAFELTQMLWTAEIADNFWDKGIN